MVESNVVAPAMERPYLLARRGGNAAGSDVIGEHNGIAWNDACCVGILEYVVFARGGIVADKSASVGSVVATACWHLTGSAALLIDSDRVERCTGVREASGLVALRRAMVLSIEGAAIGACAERIVLGAGGGTGGACNTLGCLCLVARFASQR